MATVKAFSDLLMIYEKENEMGRVAAKEIPIRKDKIVQFVWDYQQKHDGDTPHMGLIGNMLDIVPTAARNWVARLVDDDRVELISTNPLRIRLLDHPKNTAAIERYKRLLAAKEKHEESEREQIRNRQQHEAKEAKKTADREAVLNEPLSDEERETAAKRIIEAQRNGRDIPTATTETTTMTTTPATPDVVDRVNSYARTAMDLTQEETLMRAVMPELLPLADDRDLVMEMLKRGYAVQGR